VRNLIRKIAVTAACSICCSLFSSLAIAQNGFSFRELADAASPYNNATVAPQMSCEDLLSIAIPELVENSVELIPANGDVPAHCRMDGVLAPEIGFQINLPMRWNRRFYMHGNGGHAGERPDSPSRARTRNNALVHGFVTASTNTGHDAQTEPGASFAYNNDQKLIDYAYRAVDLTADTAKALAAEFYDRSVSYSYWDGCSTGGRQGLMNAQRFPDNFDGIIAGAPVSDFSGTTAAGFWFVGTLREAQISDAQIQVLSETIYAQCDALDGAEDGLIEDPRQCSVDFRASLPNCSGSTGDDNCFNETQLTALEKVYGGMVSNGDVVYPGLPLGGEKNNGWLGMVSGEQRLPFAAAIAASSMQYMVFEEDNPDYDWRSFDFDTDMSLLDGLGELLDTRDPDLSAFKDRGGKLIMHHGWADNLLVPGMSTEYFDSVIATHGDETDEFARLYMVPGMGHCRGGFGADRFDLLTPLINWVENGVAPGTLTADSANNPDLSRLLCPYPQAARYSGQGDVGSADSYVCVEPVELE